MLIEAESVAAAGDPDRAARLTAEAEGMVRVYVGGVATVADNETTGATPGQILRSGRDTRTVGV